MSSSTLRALGCLLLALSAGVVADAQNQRLRKPGSISGKITLKGTGIAGIPVGAIKHEPKMMGRVRFGTVTDTQGNYRISDLEPGTYEVAPVAPQFVFGPRSMSKRVIVEEGEALDGIDFSLVRGGVITGKVTNADGQPLIEEQVHLALVEVHRAAEHIPLNIYFHQTDDRGMYRMFGVPPGKYTVSAGIPESRLVFAGRNPVKYKQTFHPSVTDSSKAAVIEVTEGSEATNVDIVVNARHTTYSVTGRIINGETGRPISNARYGLTKIEENGSSGTSGPATNAMGEFKIDSLLPGKYMVTLEQTMNGPLADKGGNPLR
jgi:protocatechuate 3,4-dioxygenase beta subunit